MNEEGHKSVSESNKEEEVVQRQFQSNFEFNLLSLPSMTIIDTLTSSPVDTGDF